MIYNLHREEREHALMKQTDSEYEATIIPYMSNNEKKHHKVLEFSDEGLTSAGNQQLKNVINVKKTHNERFYNLDHQHLDTL